jgi:nucleoside-diphosphate-sugar epimerase
MQKTSLILGANGRFGRAAAEAFWNAGWRVRIFDRATDRLPDAARGADVIVNGWNPPYPRWAAELPALTEQVIGAARASGATLIQPANVYVYGPGAPAVLTGDTPHAATNPLGRLRIEMEDRLRASGLPVILLRAGDFIDTEASGNWLDRILLGKLAKGRLVHPGDPEIDHTWAFLPDLARAAVALAERSAPDGLEEVLFPGHTLSGREILAHARAATGQDLRLVPMAWWPLRLARPFWPMADGLIEMRYLWSMPHRLDGDRFARQVPGFEDPTPAEEAIAAAVRAVTRSQAATADQPNRFSMKRLQGRSA